VPAREWKQRASRVLDRFVPSVPFRYLPPKHAVRIAFNVILDREPDPAGGAEYATKLASGELSRHGVAEALAHSEEFRRRVPITNVLLSMHVSRSEFVAGLPPAARILDLGGTHQGLPDGALVHLGYPYPFERLVVVDLPVDERDTIYRGGSTGDTVLSVLALGVASGAAVQDAARLAGGHLVGIALGEVRDFEQVHDLARFVLHLRRDLVIGPDAHAAEESREHDLVAGVVSSAHLHPVVGN